MPDNLMKVYCPFGDMLIFFNPLLSPTILSLSGGTGNTAASVIFDDNSLIKGIGLSNVIIMEVPLFHEP